MWRTTIWKGQQVVQAAYQCWTSSGSDEDLGKLGRYLLELNGFRVDLAPLTSFQDDLLGES